MESAANIEIETGAARVREGAHGEVVFPNNIERLRKARGLTQAELGRLLTPPMGISTISKIEAGVRRLSNLQLEALAAALAVAAEDIPLVKGRDAAGDVQKWGGAQRDAVRWSVDSGAAAIAYVLAALRTKHGHTQAEVGQAIGKTISVYHRIEMGSRLPTADELKAIAALYDLTPAALNTMIEEQLKKQHEQLAKGVPPEDLLPRRPRALLWDQEPFAGAGILERAALRRSVRVVSPHTAAPAPTLPVYGAMAGLDKPAFVLDRAQETGRVPVPDFVGSGEDWFAARVFSNRVGIALRPNSLVYVNRRAMPTTGDLVLFVRRADHRADCAVLVSDDLRDMRLRLYNPDEEIALGDPAIAEVHRIAAIVFP